jgi:tetratricopeptide (TPR) repeat protein
LLGSFCQPVLQREEELAEAALWLGLGDENDASDASSLTRNATGSWLRALQRCETQLSSDVEIRELQALTRALKHQAAKADREGRHVPINELWDEMSRQLRASLENGGGGHATSSSTLRGRRWGNLRMQIATALAYLTQYGMPTNLLPRNTREMSTFTPSDYRAVRDALTERSCGGLAVIAAPPGSGKSELALSYVRHEGTRYDHIFWLRAANRVQLEHDFLEMARILARKPGGRAHLRREAFGVLENTSRWLIIFDSVIDPAVLLPYLPWNADGHKLCTYWADPRTETERARYDDAWLTYFNVQLAQTDGLLKGLKDGEALAFLRKVIRSVSDPTDLSALAELVSPSRLATILAAKWINYSHCSITDYIADWHGIEASTEHDSRAYRAAVLTFRGLSQAGKGSVDEAAADLLWRLEPYGAATFPEDLLDDPSWEAGDSPLGDRRLAVLEELGLADKSSQLPHTKYFAVNAIVRAVAAANLDETSQVDNLTIASRTLLHLLLEDTGDRSLQTKLELLPDAEHLAKRLAPLGQPATQLLCTGPLLAIEFLAHAAAIHLGLSRIRGAAEPLRLINEIAERYANEIRVALALPEQIWDGHDIPPAPVDYRFDRPIERMGRLLLAMRLDGFPAVASAVYKAIDQVLQSDSSGDRLRPCDGGVIYKRAKANIYFHGALACRDMDQMRSAESAVAKAIRIWEDLGDQQGIATANNVTALLQRDIGNLHKARELAKIALTKQRELMDENVTTRAQISLARDLYLLASILREEGRWSEAARLMSETATAWSKVPRSLSRGQISGNGDDATLETSSDPARRAGLEINELGARSSHTLLKALLGELPGTEREALQCWGHAQAIYPQGHRKAAKILADAAEVMHLVGDVRRARSFHVQALEMSERLWDPDHRITTRVRRACAATLLDAGDPNAALLQLLRILALPSANTIGTLLGRARAWATLGRLLIDVSVSVNSDDDHRQLDLAGRALKHAQLLFDATTGSEHTHPDVAMCLLGHAEIAIRRDNPAALGLAQEACDLIRNQFSLTSNPLILPRARIVRARAMPSKLPLSQSVVEQLERETVALQQELDAPGAIHTPADRVEVALAAIAADWARSSATSARNATLGHTVYDNARRKLDAAVKPLDKQLSGERHQLFARSYAELARLAHKFVGPRQRARNARERDRLRPALDLTHEQLSTLDEWLREETTHATISIDGAVLEFSSS